MLTWAGDGGVCLHAGGTDQSIAWAADRILNDGLYRLLAEFRDLAMPQNYKLWRAGHKLTGPVADYTVFGPACGSIASLPSTLHLPTGGARGRLFTVFWHGGVF